MNADQFACWFKGFIDGNGGKQPDQAQWSEILINVRSVFGIEPFVSMEKLTDDQVVALINAHGSGL